MNKLSFRTVTVFGSSMPRTGEEEYEAAYKLGKILGKNNFNVCTGGYQGIMDAVSKGAVEMGRDAIGVTVQVFQSTPSQYITKEIKCRTLIERIEQLIALGDAYIILRGGTGTLVELSIVWEYLNKGLMKNKPAAAHGEMWFRIIDEMEKRIAFEKRKTGVIKVFSDVEKCADHIVKNLKS